MSRSGKPLTEASGEELVLVVLPFIVGGLFGGIMWLWIGEMGFVFGIGGGVITFMAVWPRIVDLGFGLKEPRF